MKLSAEKCKGVENISGMNKSYENLDIKSGVLLFLNCWTQALKLCLP